jgi:hypothetical protein
VTRREAERAARDYGRGVHALLVARRDVGLCHRLTPAERATLDRAAGILARLEAVAWERFELCRQGRPERLPAIREPR